MLLESLAKARDQGARLVLCHRSEGLPLPDDERKPPGFEATAVLASRYTALIVYEATGPGRPDPG